MRGAGGRIVCRRCELAETFATRARGLQGRAALPAGEGPNGCCWGTWQVLILPFIEITAPIVPSGLTTGSGMK